MPSYFMSLHTATTHYIAYSYATSTYSFQHSLEKKQHMSKYILDKDHDI